MADQQQSQESAASKPSELPSPTQQPKPQRMLACLLCQQRKVKCDRNFPCANCVRSRSQCVQVSHPRRRKRRFPERQLLDRIRRYEELLRQNNINFEPLHKEAYADKDSPTAEGGNASDNDQIKTEERSSSSPSAISYTRTVSGARSIWHAMSKEFRNPNNDSDSSDDDVREVVIKKATEQVHEGSDNLLFGWQDAAIDISTLHPNPVEIFRLWNTYLENVDPLLNVTHTPSLQGRIIEAASQVSSIDPDLEALMFSIYSVSLLSISSEDCLTVFGVPRDDLLVRYQQGCQQALLNCRFLRCNSRDCLTALYLYLVSVRPFTVPQAISSMLGVAVRIAEHMSINSEANLANCTVLEAEMRRRLWWALTLFDTRISEMANARTTLTPAWDCKVPLNVNDSDIRAEMSEPPHVHGRSSEALFAVVRCELGDFVRHTVFHRHLFGSAVELTTEVAQDALAPDKSELTVLEKMMEEKYFKFCDLNNPLHFMTVWTTRGYIMKLRLWEHFFRYHNLPEYQTDARRGAAFSYAIGMLECDTQLMTTPMTRKFAWFTNSYYPFPAYLQILQTLKRRPTIEKADYAWSIMSDNFEPRFPFVVKRSVAFFNILKNLVLHAWEARETACKQVDEPLQIPRIVSAVRYLDSQIDKDEAQVNTSQSPGGIFDMGANEMRTPTNMGIFGSGGLFGSQFAQGYYSELQTGSDPLAFGMPAASNLDLDQLNWSSMDWSTLNDPSLNFVGTSRQL